TFVSIDDCQSAEWNTDALGPNKRALADDLIRRLRDRFAPAGLLHHGQGKWYPGEPLPRWGFSLFWRRDGEPTWRDKALLAPERQSRKLIADDAERFAESVAVRLGITADHVIPAFEDPAERMLKEGELPDNIDPGDPKIDNQVERARIMRMFERQLSLPTGFVLPVQRWNVQASGGWVSERWQLRRRRLYLIPGDSPIGLRLPLNSLPYVRPADYPHLMPADPFDERGELASSEAMARAIRERSNTVADQERTTIVPQMLGPSRSASAAVPVRTALAVE